MYKLLFYCFCIIGFAQNKALYISDFHKADVFTYDIDSTKVLNKYYFTDSISVFINEENSDFYYNLSTIVSLEHAPSSFRFSAIIDYSEPIIQLKDSVVVEKEIQLLEKYELKFNLGSNTVINDSLIIEGKQYQIALTLQDDGFVGGRPNQVNQRIFVSELGLIYSYSNYIMAHNLFMISHQNSQKQKVLTQVYDFIESQYPNLYRKEYQKITNLSRTLNFEDGISTLTQKWMNHKNKLIVSYSNFESLNNEIHYKIKLKNLSSTNFYLPKNYIISPTTIAIHQPESVTKINLSNRYRSNYQYSLRKNIYLESGEEIEIPTIIFKDCYPNSCLKKVPSGFQVYNSGNNALNWITFNTISVNNEEYIRYPFRIIE